MLRTVAVLSCFGGIALACVEIKQPPSLASSQAVVASDTSKGVLIDVNALIPHLKEIADRAALVQNTFAGMSAVVSSVCFINKHEICGAVGSMVSGSAWLGSALASQASRDLSNVDFSAIATIADGGDREIAQLPMPTRAVVSTLIKSIELSNVAYTTANRALAAAKSGSDFWVRQQVSYLMAVQEQLRLIEEDLVRSVTVSEWNNYIDLGLTNRRVSEYVESVNSVESQIVRIIRDSGARSMWSCMFDTDDSVFGYAHRAMCKGLSIAMTIKYR